MKIADIREKVVDIITHYVNMDKEEIHDISNIRTELYFNSIEFINFIGDIETSFDIEVLEEDIRSMYTVADVVEYIAKRQIGSLE